MFVTVLPPIVDAALVTAALGVTAFWAGVFLLAGVARMVDRVAPSPFDSALPVKRPAPAAPIAVLEEEVAP